MSSDSRPPGEAFVWTWLPGTSEPVVAGRLEEAGGEASFLYGQSYLQRPNATSLYTPELPLTEERIRPLPGLDAPGCILDARPDAWGQRVIMNRLIGAPRPRARQTRRTSGAGLTRGGEQSHRLKPAFAGSLLARVQTLAYSKGIGSGCGR
jgi:hypothetical protein